MNTHPQAASRPLAFFYVALSYFAGLAAALATGYYFLQAGYDQLSAVFAADFAGTVVVFAFSFFFNNSSFYDPYWSIIPIIIAIYFAWLGADAGADTLRASLLLLLVAFWGIRLTFNWARGWLGLGHQDWRYIQLQARNGKWYWLVSFTGIHLFPTILVYLGCLSLYPAMSLPGNPLGWLDLLAFAYTLSAILLELVADEQLHRFLKNKKRPGETMAGGVWRYSRHPNYLGETAFWWGLFLFALAARPDYWWTIAGPVSITLLFHFISIPMTEKRMRERRENFESLVQTVPRWIPVFWPGKGKAVR